MLILRNARVWEDGLLVEREVAIQNGRVTESVRGDARTIDLEGRVVLPGLVNAHDHLDFSTFPALGRPPYASVYDWARDVDAGAGDPSVEAALSVPLVSRLFLGGLRNVMAGVTAVAHHGAFHRSLGREDFPVRVLSRYHFAHSPGITPHLRRTYRTTDRRIPWMVHAGEGTDERCRGELDLLAEQGVLRQNTVIIHAIAFGGEDARRMSQAHACVVWCPESNRRLYGATARVGELRTAGVRVGLGSDSPVSGVRDPLSNLAAARQEAFFTDAELIALATVGSAEVARLPGGGTRPGAPADLVVADTLEGLLAGDRGRIALVIVGGRAVYGQRRLMEGAAAGGVVGLAVDGHAHAFEAGLGRRALSLLRALPTAASPAWVQGLDMEDTR